jgi:hypothetical protein
MARLRAERDRVLADHDYVHMRDYGSEQQTDFKV